VETFPSNNITESTTRVISQSFEVHAELSPGNSQPSLRNQSCWYAHPGCNPGYRFERRLELPDPPARIQGHVWVILQSFGRDSSRVHANPGLRPGLRSARVAQIRFEKCLGSATALSFLSSRAKPRDLRFRGPLLETRNDKGELCVSMKIR
jgi:hypothetical protein